MIKLLNSLKKKKIIVNKNKLKIYVCGVTIYDKCHLGHARSFIFFDLFLRLSKLKEKKIILIRNITDFDDKIINKCIVKNSSINYLTNFFCKKMYYEIKSLFIIDPTFEPKASFFISNMFHFTKKLIKIAHAYINKGNILYNIHSFAEYGILSNKNKFFKDFILWNFTRSKRLHKIASGRPGWHTECATMSSYYCKNVIDLHSGGIDLKFPHHENEIAQIFSLKNSFTKIWIHIGNLLINKTKMSKSKSNQILLSDILYKYKSDDLKLMFLQSKYNRDLNFTLDSVKSAHKSLASLKLVLSNINKQINVVDINIFNNFVNTIMDDFNTSSAISLLYKKINEYRMTCNNNKNILYTVKLLFNFIGLLNRKVKKSKEIIALIEKQKHARKFHNWMKADLFRCILLNLGVKIKDNKIT